MKRIPRRDRLKIYGDLLSALDTEDSTEKLVLTRVQARVNVPFDRLKDYISEVKELGFIQGDNDLKLTKKGKQYLREYEEVIEFMKRMGLTY